VDKKEKKRKRKEGRTEIEFLGCISLSYEE
jgi:hypothetical protein